MAGSRNLTATAFIVMYLAVVSGSHICAPIYYQEQIFVVESIREQCRLYLPREISIEDISNTLWNKLSSDSISWCLFVPILREVPVSGRMHEIVPSSTLFQSKSILKMFITSLINVASYSRDYLHRLVSTRGDSQWRFAGEMRRVFCGDVSTNPDCINRRYRSTETISQEEYDKFLQYVIEGLAIEANSKFGLPLVDNQDLVTF